MRKKPPTFRIGVDASRAFINQPTGTERYAYEIITRMLRLPEAGNYEWMVYLKKGQYPRLKDHSFGLNVRVIEIPMTYLWTQVGLAYRTWVDKLDLLWVPAHTLPVLRKPGTKSVVTIHGIEYEWLPAYESWLQRWYLPLSTQYATRYADKIIAVSNFTKCQLIERLKTSAEKITVIHEGFDFSIPTNINNVSNIHDSDILRGYGLWPGEYMITIGTIQPRKNLEKLIKVFAKISKSERGKVKLVVVGKWGWNFDEVRAAPNKYEVADEVIFTGYVEDRVRQVLLSNSMVYVQPSITEGFGLPILEAMATGIPVASSSGGALPEVTANAGVLFDAIDEKDMEKKLTEVISNGNLRKRLTKMGRIRAGSLKWQTAVEKTMQLIVNCLNL